jgi:hypothetical protein
MLARQQKPELDEARRDTVAVSAMTFKVIPQPNPDWTALHQETTVQFETTIAYLAK